MSVKVERCLPLLEQLLNASPATRRSIIKNANPILIDAVCEIAFNYLCGNIRCSTKQFKTLALHKSCLRKLVATCRGKKTINKKLRQTEKKILVQKGGAFWAALLAPVVSELTAYFMSKAF